MNAKLLNQFKYTEFPWTLHFKAFRLIEQFRVH